MKITQMIIVRLGFVQTGKWKFRMARTPPCQTRPQSVRYFCPADEATTALEESKTETWFRFNCSCVKLFTHLTKKSSQGNFRCSHIVTIYSFQSSFSFCDLWSMYLVKKMYIYLNTTNEHLLVTTTYILSCSEWAQQ